MSRTLEPARRRSALPTPAAIAAEDSPELGISYLRAGAAGPAVLMLHGWGAFKELWWSTMGDLGRDHRCYAIDFPGHGGSPIGRADTIAGLAEQAAAFCDQLGLSQITLLGHSMGGCVAVELALQRPGLVRRLVLVDAAVESHAMPFFVRTYLQPGIGWPALRLSQMLGRLFRPLGMRVPHAHGGGWVRPWLRRAAYLASFDPDGLHRQLRSLFSARDSGRLAGIGAPTLVISGQLDALVPTGLSQQLATRIPGARYVQISAALHNPMDERPQAFGRAVRAFLETP